VTEPPVRRPYHGDTRSAVPPLEEIRPAVQREWQHARRTRVLDEAYRRMRERYDVVVETDSKP
jgi:hypothetical protein